MNALPSRSFDLLGGQKDENSNAVVSPVTLPAVSLCQYSVLWSDDTCPLSLLPGARGQLLKVQEIFTKSLSISNSFLM